MGIIAGPTIRQHPTAAKKAEILNKNALFQTDEVSFPLYM